MGTTSTFSGAILAGIILGAIILIIGIILLIWFIATLNDLKRYLKSIDSRLTKANQNLGDIKLYNYQLNSNKQNSSNNAGKEAKGESENQPA